MPTLSYLAQSHCSDWRFSPFPPHSEACFGFARRLEVGFPASTPHSVCLERSLECCRRVWLVTSRIHPAKLGVTWYLERQPAVLRYGGEIYIVTFLKQSDAHVLKTWADFILSVVHTLRSWSGNLCCLNSKSGIFVFRLDGRVVLVQCLVSHGQVDTGLLHRCSMAGQRDQRQQQAEALSNTRLPKKGQNTEVKRCKEQQCITGTRCEASVIEAERTFECLRSLYMFSQRVHMASHDVARFHFSTLLILDPRTAHFHIKLNMSGWFLVLGRWWTWEHDEVFL